MTYKEKWIELHHDKNFERKCRETEFKQEMTG
jgi:hypothetical protein